MTHFWIETCIHEETVVPPADRLCERPVSYAPLLPSASTAFTLLRNRLTPFAKTDGPSLNISISSFEEPEATHVKYFVKQLGMPLIPSASHALANSPVPGGTTSITFDRARSHLVHAAVDADEEPTGQKAVKAREWGIPVVGVKWLRNWAQGQADERDTEMRRASLDRKGKGRAFERGQFPSSWTLRFQKPNSQNLQDGHKGRLCRLRSTTMTRRPHSTAASSLSPPRSRSVLLSF